MQCNGGGYKDEYKCNEGLRVGSWGSWLWQEDISYVWLHIHQVLYFCALFVGGCMYQSVTNIFEYSNILVTNIYSNIRSYQFFFYKYIWTFVRVKFVCTNIFGHSLVSVLECKT